MAAEPSAASDQSLGVFLEPAAELEDPGDEYQENTGQQGCTVELRHHEQGFPGTLHIRPNQLGDAGPVNSPMIPEMVRAVVAAAAAAEAIMIRTASILDTTFFSPDRGRAAPLANFMSLPPNIIDDR